MARAVKFMNDIASAALPVDSFRGQIARRIVGRPSYDPVWIALEKFASRHHDVVFVQIGSHNGRANDPLARFLDRYPGWRGLMVEPIPAHFAALSKHRGSDARFELVRTAITDCDGSVEMTTVDVAPGMHPCAGQLSSLHLDVVLK